MSYILLHNNKSQNGLPRWKNPRNSAPENYYVLSLSSLTIKSTKEKRGKGELVYFRWNTETESWVHEIRYNSFGTRSDGCTGNETTVG